MIIGVCGFIGSGKDTVADYLVNFHEFRRESFANTQCQLYLAGTVH